MQIKTKNASSRRGICKQFHSTERFSTNMEEETRLPDNLYSMVEGAL